MSEIEMTKAAADVLAERRRQIETEGWTPEREFKPGSARSMLVKAAALILAEIERLDRARGETRQPFGPNNPPRLRKPGESLADYRAAMGWS